MTAIFTAKAPGIMRMLMADFGLTVEDAAAILGNLGHESGGFKSLQEIKPVVPGSRGGYGWAQWTGPRRLAFEAYCQRNGLEPSSDKANYGFLFSELKTTEAKAIPAVKAAVGLAAKVRAFEAAFERAGVKHYPSREQWAARALAAYAATAPVGDSLAEIAKKAAKDAAVGGTGGAVAGGARDTAAPVVPDAGMDLTTVVLSALAVAAVVFVVSFAWRWWQARSRTQPLDAYAEELSDDQIALAHETAAERREAWARQVAALPPSPLAFTTPPTSDPVPAVPAKAPARKRAAPKPKPAAKPKRPAAKKRRA